MAKRTRRSSLPRITRLLEILGLLQASRGQNSGSLALACGVSRRTIFRDLDTLREAGVPLVYDSDRQVYYIPSTYFLPPTSMTPEEALAVIFLCHEFGGSAGLPYQGPAKSAAIKLENALPGRLREELRRVSDALHVKLHPLPPAAVDDGIYRALVEALAKRRSVRVKYDGVADGKMISTKLMPYEIFFGRHSWYVIGRSSLHRATRTFHLGRVKEVDLLEDTYEIPRGFSLKRYFRNAWHMIPEKGPDQEVLVLFSKKVARNDEQVIWHPTQQTSFRDDGQLEFRCCVSGIEEISWWILGYGDQAEVIEPPELRQRIAQRAESMTKIYRS